MTRCVATPPLAGATNATALATTTTTTAPLYAREVEYEAVVAFVHARVQQQHCRALFVFGACGCGKTTTVLRVLRAVSQRPLAIDRTRRTTRPATATATTRSTSTSRVTSRAAATTATALVASSSRKRARDDEGDGERVSVARYSPAYFAQHYPTLFAPSNSSSSSSSHCTSRRTPAQARRRSGVAASRPVQGHYVNCADCTAPQLVEAVCASLRTTCARPDAATRRLIDAVAQLAKPCRQATTTTTTSTATMTTHAHTTATRARTPLHIVVLDEVEYARTSARAALAQLATLSLTYATQLALVYISNQRELVHHVPQALLQELPFAAYDVATLRRLAHDLLAQRLQLQQQQQQQTQHDVDKPPTRSNSNKSNKSRSRSTRQTASSMATAAVAAADTTAAVCISASLYEYMARKTLLHFSGDVRQLAAMCERVAETACVTQHDDNNNSSASSRVDACMQAVAQHTRTTATGTRAQRGHDSVTGGGSNDAAATRRACANNNNNITHNDDDDSNKSDRSSGRGSTASTRSSTSSSSTAAAAGAAAGTHDTTPHRAAAAVTATTTPPPPPTPPRVVTLGACIDALKGNVVEEQLHRHVSTMPEQVLYVLCCLIVLTQRQTQWRERALYFAVGDACPATTSRSSRGSLGAASGRRSTSARRSAGAASTSDATPAATTSAGGAAAAATLRMRDVHQLYTALMGERHFPSMHAGGVALAIDSLADLGILTRPQRKGNEELFCLNGVWSLQAMQEVLAQRGEALRHEAAACGLDASENKFVCVLRDLKRLAHVDA